MSSVGWLAVLLVASGAAMLAVGLLARVYAREQELADILDLPWGERDVDLGAVAERHSQIVEGTLGLTGRVIDRIDARGALLGKLDKSRLPVRPAEFAISVVAAGLVLGVVIGVSTSNAVLGTIGLLVSPLVANAYLDRRIRRRRAQFEEQFAESLTLIASSLTAGHTFLRAIQTMQEQAGGPLAEEFGRVVSETQLGDPVVDALDRMAVRLEIRDVEWVVQAIRIQQNVGGKLADLLHTLADYIRAREEIRREVDVLTAEGKMSAYVLGGLPVLLLFAISVLNPGYMDPMYRGWGWAWLGGAAALVVVSVGIILRMVKSVEV